MLTSPWSPHCLLRGQFPTPAALCDWMLALALPQGRGRLLDAGCGAGAFLIRSLSLPYIERFGVEQDGEALALAQVALGSEARLWHGNFIGPLPTGWDDFDAVIGNPPYVRHEHLRQSPHYDKDAARTWLTAQYQPLLKADPALKPLFHSTADLYLWFYLRAALLLKPGGRLVFVTSNSWLNSAIGQHFGYFLNRQFHIRAMIESNVERWFPDAAVNPLILALEKKAVWGEPSEQPVALVRLHAPLGDWCPASASLEGWPDWERDPAVTVRRIAQERLCREPVSRWGLIWRGPDCVLDLMNRSDAWVPLDTLGTVRYPLKTGINRFFYVNADTVARWGIEPEYRVPVIKSARDIRTLQADASQATTWLFACPLTKDALAAAGHDGARRYIEWGERQLAPPRQKRERPVPWPEVPSVQGHHPWHAVHPLPPAHVVCNRFIDRRFFFAQVHGRMVEDQTFYGLTLHDPVRHPPDWIAALLNGTLSYLLLELLARRNLGEGVLQFARQDMAAFPVLNPERFSPDDRQRITACYLALRDRPVRSIEDEVAQADRQALDRAILEGMGLADAEAWRQALAGRLCALVAERRRLARSGRRRKTSK